MSKFIISIASFFLFLPYESSTMWRSNSLLLNLIRAPLTARSLHVADQLLWESNLKRINQELEELNKLRHGVLTCKATRQDWLREINDLEKRKRHAQALLNLKPDAYCTYE